MAIPLVFDHERWTIDAMLDHDEHAIDVMGDEHVALGSDFVRQLVLAGALPRLLADTAIPPAWRSSPHWTAWKARGSRVLAPLHAQRVRRGTMMSRTCPTGSRHVRRSQYLTALALYGAWV